MPRTAAARAHSLNWNGCTSSSRGSDPALRTSSIAARISVSAISQTGRPSPVRMIFWGSIPLAAVAMSVPSAVPASRNARSAAGWPPRASSTASV